MPSIGTAVGAGVSLISGRRSSKAAERAADTQSQSAIYAADLAQDRYEQTREDLTPWRETGEKALYTLRDLLGLDSGGDGPLLKDFSLEDFEKEPGYEFRLGEGEKAINRNAAGRGNYDSGATMKALLRFNQDYASNEYTNAYNRDNIDKTRKYNFLAGVGDTGQTTAVQTGQFGAQSAVQQGNLITAAGNARAAGIVSGSNARTAGLNNAIDLWNQDRVLRTVFNPHAGGGYAY